MKYHILTYGCQYNEWEAARINYILEKLGFIFTNPKEAEIIFINACAVRKSAVDRMMGQVHNWQGEVHRSILDETRMNNPSKIPRAKMEKKIIISGCILDNDQKKLAAKNVILWDGNLEKLKDFLTIPDRKLFAQLIKNSNTSSAYLPIMSGCNNFCSYCAVPYTKGREVSRPFDEIVTSFKDLVSKGYKVITLLGQNVNSYQYDFAKLLKTLNNISGDFKIYFTSNHPKDMTSEVIDVIASSSKVAKEIHLPFQSGSDKILRAMNRPYTKKQYLDLVRKIKAKIPNIKISTDVIVGFPGETEEDFQQTVKVFKKVGYFIAYVNKYSPRFGTVAHKLGDPIPWSEKQRRWRILDEIANRTG
ncbi:MAG: MiaB/RimO family radical SAM methylthiotransferase [bacterium]|nr:MiaB/RimO family radical SAM methylthiotransferase [bacterium]